MQTCPSLLRSGVNRSDKIREHVVPVSLANFDAAVGFVHVGMLVGPAGLDSLASPAGIVMLVGPAGLDVLVGLAMLVHLWLWALLHQ